MHHNRIALACIAVIASLAACSAPAKAPPPTVDFGPNGGTSVGMPGMSSMPAMGSTPSAPTSAAPPVAGTTVNITNFAFAPANLSVKVGDTVTWTNKDEDPHTVVADGDAFRSQVLGSGGTYSFTFPAAGTFAYVCSIHPFMRGTVVVTA